MTMKPFTIGQLSLKAGLNVQTIYFYERRGLLPRARRNASGYRLYDDEALRRVLFVKRAQELGFALKEIIELLAIRMLPNSNCDIVRSKTEGKLSAVESKLRDLARMRDALSTLVVSCRERAIGSECPILTSIDVLGSAEN